MGKILEHILHERGSPMTKHRCTGSMCRIRVAFTRFNKGWEECVPTQRVA